MSVRMSEAEVAEFLAASHTGILATLRASGAPALVPLWFVLIDGDVYLRTLRSSAKAKHIVNDPRVSFLVESGEAWAELKAVVFHGVAAEIESHELMERIDDAWARKYANFLMPSNTPSKTREHYAASRIYVRVVPEQRTLTWDNSKVRSA